MFNDQKVKPRFLGPLNPEKSSQLGLLGLVLLFATFAYLLVFVQVGYPLNSALQFAVLNILSAAIPGYAAWKVTQLMRSTAPTFQALVHLLLSLCFSWAWYTSSVLIGALLDVTRGNDWALSWLPDNALAWQLAQGLGVYAAIVASAYAFANRLEVPIIGEPNIPETSNESKSTKPKITRYLTKAAEGFASFEVAEIVLVEGADDYSQVTLKGGQKRLVKLSLKAFEAELDAANFVRIHRSMLLSLDSILSVEPDGSGRMLLSLTIGRDVRTSRHGAQKLRERMI